MQFREAGRAVVVVATATTMASMLDTNHAACIASARTPSSPNLSPRDNATRHRSPIRDNATRSRDHHFLPRRHMPSFFSAGGTHLTRLRLHTPSSSTPVTHVVEHIMPGRIDERSTAAAPPLASTHGPTHGQATSPHRCHDAGHHKHLR